MKVMVEEVTTNQFFATVKFRSKVDFAASSFSVLMPVEDAAKLAPGLEYDLRVMQSPKTT